MSKIKFAFISNHPAPYRDTFLQRLEQSGELDVTVFSQFTTDLGHPFWALSNPPYSMQVLAQRNKPTLPVFFRYMTNFVLSRRFDCVCWNGFNPYWYHMVSLFIAAFLRRNYGIYVDTVRERHPKGLLHFIKAYIIGRASFFFVPGSASREFLVRDYNVQPNRVCLGAYSLDGLTLESEIISLRNQKAALRKKYGIGDNQKVFLMVANMLPTRRYPLTTAAFLRMCSRYDDALYIIVGKGPDLSAMQALGAKNHHIKVIPGCSFNDMKELYALSDVYVHGGMEPASTALVIGGIAGLPLISSKDVGCCYDCVRDGVSGIEVKDPVSEDEWTSAFERMYCDCANWGEMGQKAREYSRSLDVDVILSKFIETIKEVCGKKE